jgi:hypothetical protein
MADIHLRAYDPDADRGAWDAFVADSWNGTFLHSRRFMAHHGDRFADRSLLVLDDRGRLAGVLPAAVDPGDPAVVVTHPGLTYGGLVRGRRLAGTALVDALAAIASEYEGQGFKRLLYKPVPHIYHRTPAEDDLFALSELGAVRVRCELSTTVPLGDGPAPNSARRQGIRNAARKGVVVVEGPEHIRPFWGVLAGNLRERHDAAPVHSAGQLEDLSGQLPANLRCLAALHDGVVVAGTILFETHTVSHTQYNGTNAAGQQLGALDLVLGRAIERARERGALYFDFGVSNARPSTRLNDGLHWYKTSFGGGGVAHELYELALPAGT